MKLLCAPYIFQKVTETECQGSFAMTSKDLFGSTILCTCWGNNKCQDEIIPRENPRGGGVKT